MRLFLHLFNLFLTQDTRLSSWKCNLPPGRKRGLRQEVVKGTALRPVEETARFLAAVREGVTQADRVELIGDDEVRV
jgi:hypothetical protein